MTIVWKFIFPLFFGALKGFMKTFKAFIEPFEAPQRSVKIKIQVKFFLLSGIWTLSVNMSKSLTYIM